MSSKTFKLSIIAGSVLAATSANAALYRVVEVNEGGITASTITADAEYYASAITPATGNCFTTDCGTGSAYTVVGDTLNGAEGLSFKSEVPLDYDNYFYIQDQDDLDTYCDNERGYETCGAWAYERWNGTTVSGTVYGGLKSEREAYSQSNYKSNSTAYNGASAIIFDSSDVANVPSGISAVTDTADMVVNKLDSNSYVIGNSSSGYFNSGGSYVQLYRQRGFVNNGSDTVVLLPQYESLTQSYAASGSAGTSAQEQAIVESMGRTMAYDSFTYNDTTYIVGSAAVSPFDYTDPDKDYSSGDVTSCISSSEPVLLAACQNFAFAQKAFAWQVDTTFANTGTTRFAVADWDSTYANRGDGSAQASVRAATVPPSGTGTNYDQLPVLVGYNTNYNDSLSNGRDMMMQAAVFRPKSSEYNTSSPATSFNIAEDAWSSVTISSATVGDGNTAVYSNSIAKDINQNLIVVGEAKRENVENGARANRLFIADANDTTPTATYFSGGIFFTGAGGEVNAINNYNEVVGSVDAETNREVGGKKRKQRAFINPYDATGSDATRRAIFNNRAWWLDDLTNGGTYSDANNKFRIFTASDINDAGVISATAFKCESGYDSTSHFSYCGAGSEAEKVVAVKLIPINGATSEDIEQRTETQSSVSREGAGLGWLSLGLLSLLGFRRRK